MPRYGYGSTKRLFDEEKRTKCINVRLNQEEYERFLEICEEYGLNGSELIRRAIDYAYNSQQPLDFTQNVVDDLRRKSVA